MRSLERKYFCPRCTAGFEVATDYCGRCGAYMWRASRLARAEREASGQDLGAPPPADAEDGRTDPWLGALVDDRYRVTEAIGRGGMGAVYKVEHQRIGKVAAMKVLRRELAGRRDIVWRFRREAEAVSRLAHPNTVHIFDFGEASGALYLIMEYVRGRDLGSILERDGPLPLARAVPLFLQIADALGEAHELGVVHRDLKPENILVTRTQRGQDFIKVLDFGLAKLAGRDESAELQAATDSIVGTPHAMAPEQIRGDPIDARADIYSLGALIYRVLTGRPPFEATTLMGVLTKHLTEPVVPPSARRPDLEIDPRADELVAQAMEKSPRDRFPDAAALSKALEAIARDSSKNAALRRPGAPSPPPKRRALAPAEAARDEGSRPALRRADLDAFERMLRRRRLLRRAFIPALIGVSLFAGVAGVAHLRGERPRTVEVEPNHHIEDATPIASDLPVRGYIGQRLSETQSDRDFYKVVPEPEASAHHIAEVRVTGLPNMALKLALYDASGQVVAYADDGGVGEGERLRERVRGPVYIMVTESRPAGSLPTENVSDYYELTATLEPASAER